MVKVSYGLPSKIALSAKPSGSTKSLSIRLDFPQSRAVEFDLSPDRLAAFVLALQKMQKRHGWSAGLAARPSLRRDLN